MSIHEIQALTIRALQNMRGDDTARAKLAFRNHTPAQMREQYGQSGKTCQQILNEYMEHDRKIDEAIAWVRGQ